jgi:hypothetical protein
LNHDDVVAGAAAHLQHARCAADIGDGEQVFQNLGMDLAVAGVIAGEFVVVHHDR